MNKPVDTPSDVLGNSTAARTPYDPAFDPLVAQRPGHGNAYAPTYWIGDGRRAARLTTAP